jgi:hypothetical protein
MAPAISAETLPIDWLVPNVWNPNQMTEAMFEKEMNSIREFGFVDPITVRKVSAELYEIIDGEHRWKAAARLGMTAVPCTIVHGLSDQQAKKLTPILNGLRGEPDQGKLADLLRDLLASETTESLLRTMPFEIGQLNDLVGIAPFDWAAFEDQMNQPGPRSKEAWVERTYRLPADAAEVIDSAIAAIKSGPDDMPDWQALEMVCADFLSGRG